MAVTIEVRVEGMSCAHCVHAVTEEVGAVAGVTSVEVTLNPEGASIVTITSDAAIADDAVAAAIDEAGYELAGS